MNATVELSEANDAKPLAAVPDDGGWMRPVSTWQSGPGRQAAEGPLHDQEMQREDDGHQPQDAEARRDQRVRHPGAGHPWTRW